MSTLTISRFELTKLLGTRRGWVSVAAFVLIWMAILLYAIEPAASMLENAEAGGLVTFLLEQVGWQPLSAWPAVELAVYWIIALYLLPFFAIVIAADQIASDKSRGTLRYLVLRTSRAQLFFGRFIGQAIIQLLLIILTLASVLALIALRSQQSLSTALDYSPIIVINLLLVLLPYIALMACVSVLAKSARQATLLAVIAWIVVSLLIGFIQNRLGTLAVLEWVLPGSQVSALMKLQGWDTLQLAPVPLLQTSVLLLIGWLAMWRSDL